WRDWFPVGAFRPEELLRSRNFHRDVQQLPEASHSCEFTIRWGERISFGGHQLSERENCSFSHCRCPAWHRQMSKQMSAFLASAQGSTCYGLGKHAGSN